MIDHLRARLRCIVFGHEWRGMMGTRRFRGTVRWRECARCGKVDDVQPWVEW